MHTQKCTLQNDGKYIYSPFLSHPNIFRAKKDKIVGLQIDIVLYTLHYRYETVVLFHKAYTGKCIFFLCVTTLICCYGFVVIDLLLHLLQ